MTAEEFRIEGLVEELIELAGPDGNRDPAIVSGFRARAGEILREERDRDGPMYR